MVPCAPHQQRPQGAASSLCGAQQLPQHRFLGPEIMPWVLRSRARPKPPPNSTLLGVLAA